VVVIIIRVILVIEDDVCGQLVVEWPVRKYILFMGFCNGRFLLRCGLPRCGSQRRCSSSSRLHSEEGFYSRGGSPQVNDVAIHDDAGLLHCGSQRRTRR